MRGDGRPGIVPGRGMRKGRAAAPAPSELCHNLDFLQLSPGFPGRPPRRVVDSQARPAPGVRQIPTRGGQNRAGDARRATSCGGCETGRVAGRVRGGIGAADLGGEGFGATLIPRRDHPAARLPWRAADSGARPAPGTRRARGGPGTGRLVSQGGMSRDGFETALVRDVFWLEARVLACAGFGPYVLAISWHRSVAMPWRIRRRVRRRYEGRGHPWPVSTGVEGVPRPMRVAHGLRRRAPRRARCSS